MLSASYLAASWQLYKLDSDFQLSRMRRYLGLASLATVALSMALTFLDPTHDPARRKFDQIALLVTLVVSVPVVAFETRRRITRILAIPEWAESHGFTVISAAPTEAEVTLPEDLHGSRCFAKEASWRLDS